MSAQKTELRKAAIHEVGTRLDDALEASRADQHRMEGGLKAAQVAFERVGQFIGTINGDMDSGKLDIVQAKMVKGYLARLQAQMAELVTSTERRMHVAAGAVLGMERAVREAKSAYDREAAKVEREAPRSIKAQRLAEQQDDPALLVNVFAKEEEEKKASKRSPSRRKPTKKAAKA